MQKSGQATSQILPELYQELRALARSRLAAAGAHSLQPTQLVHEAYLKFAEHDWQWQSRAHFFAAAAQAIRRVLLDHAREKNAQKRGNERQRVTLSELADAPSFDVDILSLDAALDELELRDATMAQLVKLRFLCGLSMAESAEVLQISERTATRQWQSARVWLYQKLRETDVN